MMKTFLALLINLCVITNVSSQGENRIKWSENQFKKLSDSYSIVGDYVISKASIFSLDKLQLKADLNNDLSYGYYNKGRFGCDVVNSYKDKKTKSRVVETSFYPVNKAFTALESTPLFSEKKVHVKGAWKTQKYLNSHMVYSNVNYKVVRKRKQIEGGKSVYVGSFPIFLYDLFIINNEGEKMFDCGDKVFGMMQTGAEGDLQNYYRGLPITSSEPGIYFLFNDSHYLKQEWEESNNEVEIFNGIENESLVSFNLNKLIKREGRILNFKVLKDGNIVIGGIYGGNKDETDGESKFLSKIFSDQNEEDQFMISGFFRLVIDKEGKRLSEKSSIYPVSSDGFGSFNKVRMHSTHITNNGGLFFTLSEYDKKSFLNYQKLVVIGVMDKESWVKNYPLMQGSQVVENSVNPQNLKHLGVHITTIKNNLIIAYNDKKENVESIDYNSFNLMDEEKVVKYVCSKHDGFTLLEIDSKGNAKPSFIDCKEMKIDLLSMRKVSDERVFILASGKNKMHFGTISFGN